LEREAAKQGVPLFVAESKHSGDNAGMIAFAAWIDPDGCDRSGVAELRVLPGAEIAPVALNPTSG
jgi:N6-L-threonylcarbamoyladenine synthase